LRRRSAWSNIRWLDSTVHNFAELLGKEEAIELLAETLGEEEAADEKLTTLAKSINVQAKA
jgi:ferritin-like metal-binding protein YciE